MRANSPAPDAPSCPRAARGPLVGTVLTLPGAVSAELLAEPFDLVWIDLEHGALGRAEAQEMILGAQAAGALAFVRLGLADAESLVGPMLDAGADGIVAADVRGDAQADWLADLTRYPPAGRRGFGPRRATLRRRIRRVQAAQPPQLWVQLESQQGVAAAEEVARTPGVDALIVGIADLCVDLGVTIGLTDGRLCDALRTVRSAADLANVRFGLAGPLQPAEQLDELLDGASVLVHSTDARLCAAAVDAAAAALRGAALGASASAGVNARG
jgi:4-hydroxy-2-oxoheptanedioate aldolase